MVKKLIIPVCIILIILFNNLDAKESCGKGNNPIADNTIKLIPLATADNKEFKISIYDTQCGLKSRCRYGEAAERCAMQGMRLPKEDEIDAIYSNKTSIPNLQLDAPYWIEASSRNSPRVKHMVISMHSGKLYEYVEPLNYYKIRCVCDAKATCFPKEPVKFEQVTLTTSKGKKFIVDVQDMPHRYIGKKAKTICPKGWELPNMEELETIYKNKDIVSELYYGEYWSSEEAGFKSAPPQRFWPGGYITLQWSFDMFYGRAEKSGDHAPLNVRCIKKVK
jgi:hypothetical protein